MIFCPDCSREHPEGTTKCSPGCGAWIRTSVRPQGIMEQRGLGLEYRSPQKLADLKRLLARPKPPPSKDWARKLLADPQAQREVAPIAVEYAKRALENRTGLLERVPGEDDDEGLAW